MFSPKAKASKDSPRPKKAFRLSAGGPKKDYNSMDRPTLERLAKQDDHQAQFHLGILLFKAEEYEAALSSFEASASNGYSHGHASLGFIYQNGNGIPRDLSKAKHYLGSAADMGHSLAAYSLAKIYIEEAKQTNTPPHPDISKLAANGAKGGHEDALNLYAKICERGLYGQPVDLLKACDLYKQSADIGNIDARINYARLRKSVNCSVDDDDFLPNNTWGYEGILQSYFAMCGQNLAEPPTSMLICTDVFMSLA